MSKWPAKRFETSSEHIARSIREGTFPRHDGPLLLDCEDPNDDQLTRLIECPGDAALVSEYGLEVRAALHELRLLRQANRSTALSPAQPAEAVPVAWQYRINLGGDNDTDYHWSNWITVPHDPAHEMLGYRHQVRPLYATPQPSPASGVEDEFAKHKNWSLYYSSKTFGDDDDEPHHEQWVVSEEGGSLNDREWEVMGFGDTPTAAITAAINADRKRAAVRARAALGDRK